MMPIKTQQVRTKRIEQKRDRQRGRAVLWLLCRKWLLSEAIEALLQLQKIGGNTSTDSSSIEDVAFPS